MNKSRRSKSRPKRKKAEPDPGFGLVEVFIDELTPTDGCVNIRAPAMLLRSDI